MYKKITEETQADILNNQGIEKCIKGDYQEDIADFDAALKLVPNHSSVHWNKWRALNEWARHIMELADEQWWYCQNAETRH